MNKLFALSVIALAVSEAVYAADAETPADMPVDVTEAAAGEAKKRVRQDAGENLQLKEMVVSAAADIPVQQRTELGRLTVFTPVSGAIVNREELEHLQLVNNLMELGKRVPGISMVRNMRIPDGGKQYTETRIDGMRAIALNTSGLDGVDVTALDRVDVITGPASALYGTGALGGTISVTSKLPPDRFEARLSQEAGSFGLLRTQGNVGNSSDDGRYGFIVTGSRMDNGGWRKSKAPANQDAAAEHKQGEGVKAFIRPFEATKITVGYDRLHYDYRWAGTLGLTQFNQDWRQVVAGTYGQAIDDYRTASVRLQQFIGERGEFSMLYGKITDDTVNYGSAGSGGANNVICDDGGALGALAIGKTVKCRAVNANAAAVTNTLKAGVNTTTTTTAVYRHEFDLAKSTLHVGTDIYKSVADTATYNNAFNALQAQSGMWAQGTLAGGAAANSVVTRSENTPFVHLEFSPVDRLRFHLGERFSSIVDTVYDRSSNKKSTQMTNKGNVFRGGVTYELNDAHLIWANLGQTFNPAATATMLDTAAKGVAGNTIGSVLKPETGLTREIGFRGRFDTLGLQYDATLYSGTNKDFVVARTCTAAEALALNKGITCNINENSGRINLSGLESMLGYAVNSWLDLGLTYTNARVYYASYKTAAANYTGNSYMAMPREKYNLRVAVKPAPGWKVELEADHMTSYWADLANTVTYARPDLFNLRASYRSRDWSYWMQALNLTNQKYATRVGTATIAGVAQMAASAGQGNSGSYMPLGLRAGASFNF